MTQQAEPIRVRVDPTNPGQFFACCGLLELANRLWPGAEGWFEDVSFLISTPASTASLTNLLTAGRDIQLSAEGGDPFQNEDEEENEREDSKAVKPLVIVSPIRLSLDWWNDKSLKTWAGSMDTRQIFVAMCSAIDPNNSDPLNQGQVVFDPCESALEFIKKKRPKSLKKREPFYLDARRGANARSVDIGFSPDALGITTVAYPVVEAFCLIGLQRCRPNPTGTPRVFDYRTWPIPLDACIIPAAVSGLLTAHPEHCFRFENAFRTDQRKHKAFTPATRITRSWP